MYNKEKTVTLKFAYKGENGKHKMESTSPFFDDLGDDELQEIGYAFCLFLKQIGYPRRKPYILMDDVDEEEAEILHEYLLEMRENSKEAKEAILLKNARECERDR